MTPTPWWQDAIGYQIYPRSFCDSNGDGIGDLPGLIGKLDYLAALGVDFLWLSPVYASPMRDNGYDISDYRAIAPEFGTLKDFDRVVAEARARGLRIVMDLVVNHCSSDHAWFRSACAARTTPEHDYFYWRDPAPDGGPPDDQRAVFGGSAWAWVEEVGRYCFCYFGPQQPDLNWQNPALRAEVYAMMRWWLDRGIGGFRMDVIDLIGKDIDARLYAGGPYQRQFLQEMHAEVLAGRDILTIGESWSVTPDTALLYCGRDARALNMVFNFNHVEAGFDPDLHRFGPSRFDLVTHKRILDAWQDALAEDGWNALYLSNHDLPRAVSFYGDDGAHRAASAKALALATYLMRGTPFVYQGDEIGMTNIQFTRLDQFRDIETLGHYAEVLAAGGNEAAFLAAANAHGRDNARTPMQWIAGPQAGFTDGTPWIAVNPNHGAVNVAAENANPDSVLNFYRALIALRKAQPALMRGTYKALTPAHRQVLAYDRIADGQRLRVIVNLSGQVADCAGLGLEIGGRVVLRTRPGAKPLADWPRLAPYEGVALLD